MYDLTLLLFSGLGKSSAVGPELVSELATMFLDTLYKA
jgi:sphinganine-1-phosphate aldolase